MGVQNSQARCLPISEWPLQDQHLWQENCVSIDPFDGPQYGASLRPASLDKAAKGYGRWLCFLATHEWLDPTEPPLDRVTIQRLRQFFRDLRLAGNADYTIIGRFDELARALRILAPGQDTSWIRKPKGTTVYAQLQKRKRHLLVPDIDVLFGWGLSVMDLASSQPDERGRLIAFRDGLLLTILASCARRLRSIALLTIGRELIRGTECYRIELSAAQVKTKKPDRFDLPPRLTPYIDHYLKQVRPLLIADTTLREFWISARGNPWTEKAIQSQVLKLSRERFGTAFGPHRFRHSIATTLPRLEPSKPAMAAELLGISAQTVQESYNRAGQALAAQSYQNLIDRKISGLLQ